MSTAARPDVGFIGFGAMGSVMARHILASGRRVIGWDRRPEAMEPLVRAGGAASATLADVGAAPVVISMVLDDAATREITLGDGGLVSTLAAGAVHIAMASISPAFSRELAQTHAARGQGYLAASVFGRPEAAVAAQLQINCSGARDVFEAVEPLLNTMGRPHWIGPEPGQAMLVKLMGNNMIFTAIELLGEMYRFLEAGGIPRATAKALLVDTLFAGPIYSSYAQLLMNEHFDLSHPVAVKDNDLCIRSAEEMQVEIPLVRFMRDCMQSCDSD